MTAPTSPRRGRPPKGSPHLTREAIVDAALQAVDAEGVDAVSMRSVARILGVDAKSLYNHVADKEGLLDAVAERILGSMRLPEPTGDVREDLRAIGHAFRDRALAHPRAAPLVLTRQLSSLDALAPVEAVLRVLRAAGCPPRDAVPILRSLVATLIGSLLREAHAGPTFGTADAHGIARRQDALERSGLSHVIEAAVHLSRFDGDAEYRFTLEFALDAVTARLASRR
ncbi:TetR/AcrR family transcriptional regulator [Streptomyces subrutilus]|uniref:TetR family transcriptional regulator n=1 Tax=Streptomyces subrutilus TaxID=36818 RepID=A0A5P2UI63_9ACTN|nr:TetR/AcrR family transcriptional regulator C-terminal domain-containing protein [Streptomyces subrutilus]QEU77471.1 TetR family transcriptional regulator [Streptomyces subrutilus]WSJ33443.1 TetR/AcrR family transcriptional regulator C-terminal domain-containing protein [Streptomyces subrutilus]GGZ47737.1 TetR family transcriptional regulator [Streptomyces subrutilus]